MRKFFCVFGYPMCIQNLKRRVTKILGYYAIFLRANTGGMQNFEKESYEVLRTFYERFSINEGKINCREYLVKIIDDNSLSLLGYENYEVLRTILDK